MENKEILDNIIVGRVDPYIYAFTTNTVPNYLKIGDTYRPVLTRLNEWKKYFPDLKEEYKEKAVVDEKTFFRDYAVHKYIEEELGKERLTEDLLDKGIYYSNEFFKEATSDDINKAIEDIKKSYQKNDNKYQFYNIETSLPETFRFQRSDVEWNLRPNQDLAVKNFEKAIENNRKNLLMYAVMRFGKSFTSMMCAKKMNANLVVIVSAKADVKNEWKKTVEIPKNFIDFEFVSSEELLRNNNIITETLEQNKKVVVFLTLQDLQGNLIKEKHKDIFKNKIDLLIVDETHFGARAESYGEILRNAKYEKDVKDKHEKENGTIDELDEGVKILDVNITLHLSGTPYRILMGSEFEKDDIISFCQFSDIVNEQKKWDEDNLSKDEPKEEWNNPYFGFPQMIRFAFNPSKKAKEKLKEYKSNGYTYAFSSLLKPESIKKDDECKHKKFINEEEILELFQVIDGSKKDENILGFLDYDKIKEGNMCRHIVCVLPYCASCDALEELIKNNQEKFKNLKEYEIINISGVDNVNQYKTVAEIKKKIKDCENNGKKTLTLTVNRMLTGSTVEEWDTMIYLKDTSSPQEYDQAIFRLQNQYVKTYVDNDCNEIKYNMKPQTLLVDFDPYRMFTLQENKSMIYNVNVEESGNSLLKQRLENELKISPIITINSNKIIQITPTDIMKEVSQYSKDKGIMDETNEIPVDLNLLKYQDIRDVIDKQAEIGSNRGLSVDGVDDENNSEDLDIPDSLEELNDNQNTETNEPDDNSEKDDNSLEKKFRTYYARILFYAFLTEDRVISLQDVNRSIESNDNNKRMAKNLGIDGNILEKINKNMNAFVLSQLDYAIQRKNDLSQDKTMLPLERAEVAINKFNRMSDSEYITPTFICNDMINMLKKDEFINIIKTNGKFLDIAGKMAEFAVSIYDRMLKENIPVDKIKNMIYTIPTSSIAYEFTRKIYSILELNIENIAYMFNSYDILKVVDNENNIDIERIRKYILQNKKFCDIELNENIFYKEGDDSMKFDLVVGNPPYQVSDGGAQASAKPIYQHFVRLSNELTNNYSSLIIPTRWFVGGKGLDDFREEMLDDKHIKELHDCLTPEDIFPHTNIRGGVCYFLRDNKYDNNEQLVKVITHENSKITNNIVRPLKINGLDFFVRDGKAIEIIRKIESSNFESCSKIISARKPFGLEGTFTKSKKFYKDNSGLKEPVKCYGRAKLIGYIEKDVIKTNNNWIEKWKVMMPYANNIGTELSDDNLNSFVSEPNSVCTETFLVVGADCNLNEQSSNNLAIYLRTKFVRFLHSLAKISQHATAKTYKFVPIQDFTDKSDIDWSKNIHKIDLQLYKKYNLSEEEINYIENKIKEME